MSYYLLSVLSCKHFYTPTQKPPGTSPGMNALDGPSVARSAKEGGYEGWISPWGSLPRSSDVYVLQNKGTLVCCPRNSRRLARNSHQPTAAGTHLPHFAKAMWGGPESTALGSDKGLGVLYSTPARFVSLAPLG